jgi:hypothetical protein
MDDDLMSLRSSASSSNKDDDLLGGFGSSPDKSEPSGWTDAGGAPDLDFGSLGEQPDWLRDLEPQPEAAAPASAPAEKKAEKKKVSKAPKKQGSAGRSRKSGKYFLGMNPFQRMILSLGLFLIVTVTSILLLLVIGAINIF